MKRIIVSILVAIVCFTAPALAGNPKNISGLKFPELAFKPPKTVRVALKNGMVLHMLEDHELPLVDISAMVRTGSAYVPEDKAGLAALAGHLWRSGGTKSVAPAELDERLEFIGAIMETSIGMDSGSIGLKILNKDMDEGLSLFADLIKNPAFDEKRFAVIKNQMVEALRRQNDEPDALVEREFTKAVFPKHPFGVVPTTKTVNGITVEECRNFYYEHIGPESFTIGIAGDFNPEEMVARFEKLFADFAPAKSKFYPIPQVEDNIIPGVYLIDKKLAQTAIRMGHVGISRKDPNFETARVMNYVLGGGGFSSRLMKEVRTVKGLAYSVWSYFTGGESASGSFSIGGETKATTTYEFISTSEGIVRQVVQNGVSPEELEQAKEAIINSFIFAFDKNSDVIARYLWIDYYDMPKDYLETYRDRIRAITMDRLKAVAAQYLHPDRMVIIVAGDKAVINSGLEKLGSVRTIEIEK